MSVYIKGMEMPKRGHTVTLTIMGGGEAVVQYYDCKPQLTVPIVYKAVPVSGHGRLGDLDELLDRAFGCLDEETFLAFQFLVNGSVTIIPASKVGEG